MPTTRAVLSLIVIGSCWRGIPAIMCRGAMGLPMVTHAAIISAAANTMPAMIPPISPFLTAQPLSRFVALLVRILLPVFWYTRAIGFLLSGMSMPVFMVEQAWSGPGSAQSITW